MSEANSTDSASTEVLKVTTSLLDSWATDPNGPVALHLKQRLLAVETLDGEPEEPGIIYPPTYADIGYNIDTLSDGTRVALIDSVGSQANRMEPIFKEKFHHDSFKGEPQQSDWLVPPIEIVLRSEDCGECEVCRKTTRKKNDTCTTPRQETRSLFDLAHRCADAVVQSSPTLKVKIAKAFEALRQTGNAGPLCALAPTSLVFGVWDSRGGSNEKRPRLVRSVIRAWDVDVLHAASQFNSVWKGLSEEQKDALKEEEAKAKSTKLSKKGLHDAPGVFRPVSKKGASMTEFRDGSPNPERRVLGGVVVRGRIERTVTVNLVALRGIRGEDDKESNAIRKYLLGLSLIAATADVSLFLREGCNLRFTNDDIWHSVPRRGVTSKVDLCSDEARGLVLGLAASGRAHFSAKWPADLTLQHQFDLAEAKRLLTKKDEDTPEDDK